MMLINKRYIGAAWETEMRHHARTVAQLRIKMEKLAKDLSWELQQHHSRLQELQLLETPLSKESALDHVQLKDESSAKDSRFTRHKKKPNRNAFAVPHVDEPQFVS